MKKLQVIEYLEQQGFAALAYSVRNRQTSAARAIKFLTTEKSYLLTNEQYDTLKAF